MRNSVYILIVLLFCISCGKIDNYDAPDSTFYGKIVNAMGQSVPQRVQATTGLKFNLYETDREHPLPQQFYAKQDGTFENLMLFHGEYRVNLEQTNFYPIDDLIIQLKGRTEYSFTVVPFCEVKNISATHISGKKVKVEFSLSREITSDCKIVNVEALAHVSPYIDDLQINHLISAEISVLDDESIESGKKLEIEVDLDKNKDFNKKYAHIVKANQNKVYIRVAVITAYPYHSEDKNISFQFVNFSDIIPVVITLD